MAVLRRHKIERGRRRKDMPRERVITTCRMIPRIASKITHSAPKPKPNAYGTNEANGPRWDGNEYYQGLKKVVTRFRNAAPTASILIVGPPDCNIRFQQNLDAVINIQLRVAAETGATYWHWRDRMGGPGSMRYWVAAGLAQGDYVHLTSPGYELLGKTLAQELYLQYQRFVSARSEVDQ